VGAKQDLPQLHRYASPNDAGERGCTGSIPMVRRSTWNCMRASVKGPYSCSAVSAVSPHFFLLRAILFLLIVQVSVLKNDSGQRATMRPNIS
jgi:hypothetical protein